MENQNNDQQGNNKKVAIAFDKNVKKLIAIVQGGENLKPVKKIAGDSLGALVTDLFKEERETIEKGVKADLKALIKGHVALEAAITEETKKLEAFKIAKMKEFNETAVKLFGRIDGLDGLENKYYSALVAAGDAVNGDEQKEVIQKGEE